MASPALQSSVLVLNHNFMAVHVITARRAFALLWKNFAEVVRWTEPSFATYDFSSWLDLSRIRDEFDTSDDWVRTVNLEIAVPRIIRLFFYDKAPRYEIKFSRRNIYARDKGRCQYCGRRFSTSELTLDHVLPRSRGGRAIWENIVCACVKCNNNKAGRTPREAGMKLVNKPVMPRRNPVIQLKLRSHKYRSWRQFLSEAYWNVELKE